MNVIRTLLSPRGAVFLLLIVLLVAVIILNPSFAQPGQIMRFIQRVAPIAIVAIGQYFVIIAGEFDLSQGSLITAQVIIAGNLVGQDDSRTLPVLALMAVFGVMVGIVNGLLTTLLKVPSFIVTLGMMLALLGGVMWWTGGAATGNPADSFRQIGRGGIRDLPLIDFVPWSVLILAAWLALGIWLTTRPLGKTLIAVGDNARAVRYAGARDWWVTTRAFIISSLSATLAAVVLVGHAGVHPSVGRGYEFVAITAVVLGGVVLGGGRGWIVAAVAGAFVLEALFLLMNIAEVPATLRDAVQGVIIIAAVAYSGVAFRARRPRATPPASPDQGKEPDAPAGASARLSASPAPAADGGTATRGD
ncbi:MULTISPECIES: ABC transporter permease [unclassified Microbacterium]|uniref:ABC transporter permease n=1 Tax=unclassified Microbacterium TaxID=2609290 RepID=UPI00214C5F38|nr:MULTISPECIES: ABC transporter permease [unclassified Microbacterium]MCR2783820.1 ABC transporter permease [Microbacterium sp. zg.B96]WIM15330.1 ABC transporter permease [Microbacterium sp. zg-B96]